MTTLVRKHGARGHVLFVDDSGDLLQLLLRQAAEEWHALQQTKLVVQGAGPPPS